MRRIFFLVVAIIAFASLSSFAQADYDGRIGVRIKGDWNGDGKEETASLFVVRPATGKTPAGWWQ